MTRPVFDLDTGDDLLEAEPIMQDVVKMRRRVLGPAHPQTRANEAQLSWVRTKLAEDPEPVADEIARLAV